MTDKTYVYDIECFNDFHSCILYHISTDSFIEFIVHEDYDDREAYFKFLEDSVKEERVFIGYNNLKYDYRVLKLILDNKKMLMSVSSKNAANMIKSFSNMVISKDRKSYNKPVITQIDPYILKHYDSKVKATSLKYLEYAMGMDNIEDMPFPHYHCVKKEEVSYVMDYNKHDVYATYLFYKMILDDEIEVRKKLSNLYNLDLQNSSEPNMAKKIFLKLLSERSGRPAAELKNLQTKREFIDFNEAIPDFIEFESPILNDVLKYLKKQKVPTLKGYFEKLPYEEVEEIIHCVNPTTLFRDRKSNKITRLEHLNVQFNGNTYYLGSGGIHMFWDNERIIVPAEDEMIYDEDCVSYYPKMCIEHGFKPEHLGDDFAVIYEGIFNERQKFPKGTVENYVLKILLNSSYGELTYLSKNNNLRRV